MANPPDPLSGRRDTSREHASRIDREYYKEASPFRRARRWLVLAAILLGGAWCAWGAIDVPAHHSPGPVAAVHAKWEQDCEACHVPFAPIKDNTWLTTAETRREIDGKCEKCHAAAAHHPLEIKTEVGSCASCHADHRGREHDLARVGDRTCVACHENISAHRVGVAGIEPSRETAPITRFDDAHHPAFTSLASDPGRLKFSHGRHMRPGLSFGAADAQEGGRNTTWTYAMLPERDRQRYLPAGAGPEDPVQLACNSCHEFGTDLPAGDLRAVTGMLAGAKPGAYALPVEFERHCAACHALPLGTSPHVADAGAVADPAAGTVPHGLDAAALRRFIESVAVRRALAEAETPEARERPLPTNASPAGGLLREDVARVAGDFAAATQSFVRGTCQKCHVVEEVDLPAAESLLAGAAPRQAVDWFRTVATAVPDVWLRKARFDHQPHRLYDCRECHAAASPGPLEEAVAALAAGGSPLDNATVMIAGRESCAVCHAPAHRDVETNARLGGARFDCVECHGYHGSHHGAAATSPLTAVR